MLFFFGNNDDDKVIGTIIGIVILFLIAIIGIICQ